MNRLFRMYQGLKREVYILCFGRFVTAMGSLIWPMLTLILKSKLGYNAEEVARWFLIFGILQIPFGLFGGKMADRYNKRNLIIIFDLISVALYLITALLPLTTMSLCIYFIGSLFQHMEWPAYDGLVAEMTKDREREKAYSLMYLASNLGVVFAPTLGGILFNNYLWLSFLLAGLFVFSSTILIFFFVPKDVERVKNDNVYEQKAEGGLLEVIRSRKILLFYFVIACIGAMVYAQFNYLLPMQMDEMFFEQGAVFYGMLTSINGFVVITCTPVFTHITLRWSEFDRIMAGIVLEIVGICSCYFYRDSFLPYILSMVVFTLGEVIHTLGMNPYLSKRVPGSHRGRIGSIYNIATSTASSLGNTVVGQVVMLYTFRGAWILVFFVGIGLMLMMFFYRGLDKKYFSLLYEAENGR